MKTALLVLALVSTSIAYAEGPKPKDDPACANITKQCEAAGYMPGEHKKDGKGLWVDCVHAVAKGKTVAGVTATADEAKTCQKAAKADRAARKAEKK